MKVRIYFNLTRGGWSIKDAKTGRVINKGTKVTTVALRYCTFHVSEAGRKRVLRDRAKNVHAYVEGYLADYRFPPTDHLYVEQVSYNPYFRGTFFSHDTYNNIRSADFVLFTVESGHSKVVAYDALTLDPKGA